MKEIIDVAALQIASLNELMDSSIKESFEKLMAEFDDLKGVISPGMKVLIKPNIVAPFEKATTSKLLLECMIRLIHSNNAIALVAESAGFEFSTAETFKILGIDKLCAKHNVDLINLDMAEYVSVQSGNLDVKEYRLPKIVFEVDKIINMPCLKGHSLTKVTLGIKNLFGFLHRETRRKIHATNLDIGIAALSKLIKVDFIVVDGLWKLDNAVYDDKPVLQGIIIAGRDLLEVDYVCCDILGICPEEIGHIGLSVPEGYPVHPKVKYLTAVNAVAPDFKNRSRHFEKQNYKYKMMYLADTWVYNLFKKSIIPFCHYYLGQRPRLNRKKCLKCDKCVKACPVDAINNYSISSNKCMKIRCFRCYNVCESGAIKKVGFHK